MRYCSDCPAVFKRQEHLNRHHAAIHQQSSIYVCPRCDRSFNRSDSFRRHLKTHDPDRPITDSTNPFPIIETTISARKCKSACHACAQAHAKCSGQPQCLRCRRRGLYCNFSARNPYSQTSDSLDCARPPIQPALQSLSHLTSPVYQAQDITDAGEHASPYLESSLGEGQNANGDCADHHVENVTQIQSLGADYRSGDSQEFVNTRINWLPVLTHSHESVPSWALSNGNAFESTSLGFNSPYSYQSEAARTLLPASITSESPQSQSIETSYLTRNPLSKPSKSLYVHGLGSREPKVQSLRQASTGFAEFLLKPSSNLPQRNDFGFSEITMYTECTGLATNGQTASAYPELRAKFYLLARTETLLYTAFESSNFPPLQFFDDCVGLFLKHAAKDIPVVHSSVWRSMIPPWLLVLAASVIGSMFHPDNIDSRIFASLQELLRRAIHYVTETDVEQDSLIIHQASVLELYAISHSPETSTFPIRVVQTKLPAATSYNLEDSDADDGVSRWRCWITNETKRRLLYFTWQLNAFRMITRYERNYLSDDQLWLPCSAPLWDAESVQIWTELLKRIPRAPPMIDALHHLYLKLEIPPGLDAGDLVPLVYGIINRTQEVAQQLRSPLKQWTPTPDCGQESTTRALEQQIEWLPANSAYAAWRNSACDCLDQLHWRLNVDTSVSFGYERPVVLHLHLARLLLLTPYDDIVEFGKLSARSHASGLGHLTLESQAPQAGDVKTSILRWLTLDDHKGRLAIIHAGAIFWHTRRFSHCNLYTPVAIFLASLVLWVYGVYKKEIMTTLVANKATLLRFQRAAPLIAGHEIDAENSDQPMDILVDRPCDDELVQLFVCRGHTMNVTMFNGICICSAEGYDRVLREGIKLLHHCRQSSFSRASEYQHMLLRLMEHDGA